MWLCTIKISAQIFHFLSDIFDYTSDSFRNFVYGCNAVKLHTRVCKSSTVYFKCAILFEFQLIPMTDIQEVIPDFQKLNRTENCIVLHMKSDTKIVITSPVSSVCDEA